MPAAKIHADTDGLTDCSQKFEQQADAVEKIVNNIMKRYQPLADGGWIGQGAAEYKKEQEEETHKRLGRLYKSLGTASKTTAAVSKTFEEGDHEAGQVLNPGSFFQKLLSLIA